MVTVTNSFPNSQSSASVSRTDAQTVLRSLEELAESLQPGDLLPSQLELIRRYNASDRSVRWALDELKRQGKVVSKRRVGTVVAERSISALNGYYADGEEANIPSDIPVSSRTIVAIATPGQSVFDRALQLLFNQAESSDLALVCRLLSHTTNNIPQSERPQGYILFGRDLLPLAKHLQNRGHRVALLGTPYSDTTPDVPCVYGDQEHGGYLATKHLLDLGHRSIAFRGSNDWSKMRRWQGHQQALAEARNKGIEVQDSAIYDEEFEAWRRNPELAKAYFHQPEAPTGIVAWNDQMAMSLLSLLSYVGIRVPNDVSLIGYDNLPDGLQVHPQLTTIDIALEHQLRVALRMLTQPEPPSPSQMTVITSTLIQRESTSVAR